MRSAVESGSSSSSPSPPYHHVYIGALEFNEFGQPRWVSTSIHLTIALAASWWKFAPTSCLVEEPGWCGRNALNYLVTMDATLRKTPVVDYFPLMECCPAAR